MNHRWGAPDNISERILKINNFYRSKQDFTIVSYRKTLVLKEDVRKEAVLLKEALGRLLKEAVGRLLKEAVGRLLHDLQSSTSSASHSSTSASFLDLLFHSLFRQLAQSPNVLIYMCPASHFVSPPSFELDSRLSPPPAFCQFL